MSKALITGSKGFVGKHLVQLLKEECDIYEFDIKDGQDLRDYEQVRQAIDSFRPDYIFHLGALTYVPESVADPNRALSINTVGSLNILEVVKNLGLKTKLLFASSSAELPEPTSPYAVSKAAMRNLAMLYNRMHGVQVVVTQAYSHTGPGKGEEFAESSFAKQIAEIERGERKKLTHGNLEAIRNFTDVRDMVVAYREVINKAPGVYPLASDQNVSMREIVDLLIGLSPSKIDTEVDPRFNRPPTSEYVEETSLLVKRTFSLPETLQDLLNYWRKELI